VTKKRDRAFWAAVSVSLLIHLSAVTLFSVVIRFPREPIDYYTLRFVNAATHKPIFGNDEMPQLSASLQPELRVPSLEEAMQVESGGDVGLAPLVPAEFKPQIGDSLNLVAQPQLPTVNIPQLEFAELSRLDLRRKSLRVRSSYIQSSANKPQDSWAWFGRELGELRDSLRRLPAGLQQRRATDAPEEVVVSTPHPGFRAYIEWMADPKDRQLLFSPPIDALMNASGSRGLSPIALVFKVNPQGRVIEVLDAGDDDAGIAASASKALFKYRFAPANAESGAQYGTLVIVSTDSAL